MQEIIEFVGKAIVGKVAGNAVYDGLKTVFGSYFDKLSSYLKKGERDKFEASLEMLLENEETRVKILDLMSDKNIVNSIKDIKKSKVDIDKDTKMSDSVIRVEDSEIRIR